MVRLSSRGKQAEKEKNQAEDDSPPLLVSVPSAASKISRQRSFHRTQTKDEEEHGRTSKASAPAPAPALVRRTSSRRRKSKIGAQADDESPPHQTSPAPLRRQRTAEKKHQTKEERETIHARKENSTGGAKKKPLYDEGHAEEERDVGHNNSMKQEGKSGEANQNEQNRMIRTSVPAAAPALVRRASWRRRKSKAGALVEEESPRRQILTIPLRRQRTAEKKHPPKEERDAIHSRRESEAKKKMQDENQVEEEGEVIHTNSMKKENNQTDKNDRTDQDYEMNERIKVISKQAQTNYAKGNHILALGDYDDILSIIGDESKREPYHSRLAGDVYLRKASVYESIDKLPKAMDQCCNGLRSYQNCRKVYMKKKSKNDQTYSDGVTNVLLDQANRKISTVFVRMASIQMKIGNLDYALDLYKSALQIMKDLRVKHGTRHESNADEGLDDYEDLLKATISVLDEIEKIEYLNGSEENAKAAHTESLRLEAIYLKLTQQSDEDDDDEVSPKTPDRPKKSNRYSIDKSNQYSIETANQPALKKPAKKNHRYCMTSKSSFDSRGAEVIGELLGFADEGTADTAGTSTILSGGFSSIFSNSDGATGTSSLFSGGASDTSLTLLASSHPGVPSSINARSTSEPSRKWASLSEAVGDFFKALTLENIGELLKDTTREISQTSERVQPNWLKRCN